MSLTQAEADRLLHLPKVFLDQSPIEFALSEPMDHEHILRSTDRWEEFVFTIERGNRNRLRLKYQTRSRDVIVLARLELNGPRHRNPPDSPYKAGEWISGSHLHLYREGLDDRVAYELEDAPEWNNGQIADGIVALESFLQFCTVTAWPPIQTTL